MISKEYIKGYLTALYDWAWWKDGELLVGSGNHTYKEIKEKMIRENNLTEKDLESEQ